MDRVPNINLDRSKLKVRNPIVSLLIYAGLFFILLFLADYLFIRKNILKKINPITQMQVDYKEKNYSKVITTGTKLLQQYPHSIIIQRYLWKSYAYTNQFDKTLQTIKEMEKLAGHEMEIYLAYCTTFRLMGEYVKMMPYCQKALEIKSNSEPAQDQIAQSLVEQKKYDEAIKYLDKISQDQPDNLKRLLLRSNIATLSGDYSKSISILEKIRSDYPDVSIVNYYLGENYFMQADYIDAAGFLQEFVDSVGQKDIDVALLENAYTHLALSYEKAKMYSNAYRAYRKAACFTIKLKRTSETKRLMNKAVAITYTGYTGLVSQKDFQKKFRKLKKELDERCY